MTIEKCALFYVHFLTENLGKHLDFLLHSGEFNPNMFLSLPFRIRTVHVRELVTALCVKLY